MNKEKAKVLVGMSGGVDSSVAAALLVEQGYEVIGAFMKNWSGDVYGPECKDADRVGEEFEECGWKNERRDAMRVAAKLGIPFLTFDFEKEYRRDVVEYLFRETQAGRTPNPDVMCNKFIKFDLFLKEADKLECDFVATGHYARIERIPPLPEGGLGGVGARPRILMGSDPNKDQSYFLWAIDPAVLDRILFPIGEMEKPEVREKARALGLEVAEKKDSTGICFVGEVNMDEFLKARVPLDPGDIVTTEGKVVGQHDGVNFYTIGQRKGIGVGGGTPYYVVEKRPETKQLIVSSNFHPKLFHGELTASRLNWFRKPVVGERCEARIRYRQGAQECQITEIAEDRVRIVFDEPQRAVTPGQSIVFYDGEEMIGGGVIEE